MATSHNPNEKGRGFTVVLVAVLLVIAVVVGIIIMNGQKKRHAEFEAQIVDPKINIEFVDQTVRLTSDSTASDAPVVDIFEDYSCPHCAELAQATDDDMLTAIEEGHLIVNIHSLNFLDRDQVGHSTKSGAATMALAQAGDAKAYWNLRKELLERMKSVHGKWEPSDYAEAAKKYGANDDAVKAIEELSNVDDYQAAAKYNSAKLEGLNDGKVSTPHVFLGNEEILGPDWVERATAK